MPWANKTLEVAIFTKRIQICEISENEKNTNMVYTKELVCINDIILTSGC